MVSSCDLDTTA